MCMKSLLEWLLAEKTKAYEGDVTISGPGEVK